MNNPTDLIYIIKQDIGPAVWAEFFVDTHGWPERAGGFDRLKIQIFFPRATPGALPSLR